MTNLPAFWERYHEAIIVGVGLLLLAAILRSDSGRQGGFDLTLQEIRKTAAADAKERERIIHNQELILEKLEACGAR